ncbi:Serine/threonine protein kinase [Malonomonas rubra DSM 5091]|uniref:Serine/threonine protein kinase n=1 Tax=Malonomonas rubra DSM 5091 TaxID=1122189 RepID=A0A1M6JT67_MALRU|nr:hypothetical protein [Malonomonas rubra]SHJ49905.1 Serine/threonine protein kinase [Malonomonas rubra DSM 5091]
MLEPGQQFGLYVIKDVIDSSTNHACYCAEDPFFNREVSLTLYPGDQFSDEQKLGRLELLLERLALLDHPSIAPIYDSGSEEGYFYYTSAVYNSENLARYLSQQPLTAEESLKIILELVLALEYAAGQDYQQLELQPEAICFDGTGRAVMTDLGIDSLIYQLETNASAEPKNLSAIFEELGNLLLQMLLGPRYSSKNAVADLLEQIDNQRMRQLLARFLLPEEWPFESYAELRDELGSFDGFETESATESRQEEQEQAQQAEKMIADVRQLVAEKNSLQKSLDEALYSRSQTEKKLNEGERQLVLAKREIARVKEEAAVAWELVAGQKYDRWRPLIWAVGGFAIGFVLSGSYGYYYSEQTRDELLAKLQQNEELIKTAAWRPAEKQQVQHVEETEPQAKIEAVAAVDTEVTVAEEVTVTQSEPVMPVEEETQSWWPAGSEFSSAAAIPIEQIKVALGLEGKTVSEHLPEMLRQEVLDTVQRWADSWARQDLSGYFSFYSENYRPELGRSQDEWRQMRSTRVTRPEWIELNVDDIKVRQISDDRIQVKLKQSYRSDFYQDQIFKSINLIKEDGQWRILMERSLGFVDRSPINLVGG